MLTAEAQMNGLPISTNQDAAAHLTSRLARVRVGTHFALHFPDVVKEPTGEIDERTQKPIMKTLFAFGDETFRGGPGYVVDWSHPLERLWCKGQEYKLENVPENELATTKPSPLGHPQAVHAMTQPARDAERARIAAEQDAHESERRARVAQPKRRFSEKEA